MEKVKVLKVNADGIDFDNGVRLYSDHNQECCESHYLCFDDITIADFDGLEFNLAIDDFFERIDGYGIALKPIHGHPVRIPGYGSNNGYYSADLTLILSDDKKILKRFDITECQVESD